MRSLLSLHCVSIKELKQADNFLTPKPSSYIQREASTTRSKVGSQTLLLVNKWLRVTPKEILSTDNIPFPES